MLPPIFASWCLPYRAQLLYLDSVFQCTSFQFGKCPRGTSGLGSSVGIATDYGLDGPGSNPGGDEIFRPGAHAASCKMGTGSFPGVKCGRGVLLTTHHLLVPWSWNSGTYTHSLGHTGPVTGSLFPLEPFTMFIGDGFYIFREKKSKWECRQ